MKVRLISTGLCVSLLLNGWMGWELMRGFLHLSGACDQTLIFTQQADLAEAGQASQESLDYVRDYYPSGSRQPTGTKLDLIVERNRELAEWKIESLLNGRSRHPVQNN